MPFWNWIKTDTPPYAEEVIINQEVERIQETLSNFSQPIPTNNFNKKFIKIETDYIYSTKPSWKDKPLSERYSFEYEGELFQIDIPHTIMESLKLDKGEEITLPIYLDPNVLTRSETYKGITIKNEKEIFLQKSFTVENLEKDINGLLGKIEELENKNNQLTTQLEKLQGVYTEWRNQFNTETERLKGELREKSNEIGRLNIELRREREWWDKWFGDENNFISNNQTRTFWGECIRREMTSDLTNNGWDYDIKFRYHGDSESCDYIDFQDFFQGKDGEIKNKDLKTKARKLIKFVYLYYRSR